MIPEYFEIFGQRIKIKKFKKLYKRDIVGFSNIKDNIIGIQESTEKYPIAEDNVNQTYFHELVHCILDKCGYSELSEDEKFVDLFGSALHQVAKSSKYSEKG